MTNVKKVAIVLSIAIVAIAIGFTAIGQSFTTQVSPSETTSIEVANPASVYCTEQGGTLTLVSTEEGVIGECELADGTVCEEWAYFRGECGEPTEDVVLRSGDMTDVAADCSLRGEGVDLHGCDLSGADLSNADLSNADLREADLSNASLSNADLRNASLRQASLMFADLSGANLSSADLTGANLRGADLSGANLTDANLRDANLRDANLRDANLRDANLRGADISGANLNCFNHSVCR